MVYNIMESVLQNEKSFKSGIDKYLRNYHRLDHLDDSNLISLSLPGLVGVLLARVAKTVFITGIMALQILNIEHYSCVFFA